MDTSTEQHVLGNGIRQSGDELVLDEQTLGAASLFLTEIT
jgi:hypothetical protein